MVMLKNKKLISLAMIVVPLVMVSMFFARNTLGISKACNNSQACREAVAKEQEANKNAEAASNSANAYQVKVAELSVEIASQEVKIAETAARVEDLKVQIDVTEKKLKSEQEGLAELLVNMHFESDVEPIRILAGASSISDLAEKAAREDVIKEQISIAAAAVKASKEQLENDKIEVEGLLAAQQEAKNALVAMQAEQQALVEKYENDAEAYNELAAIAREEQKKAEQKEQEDHPELYRGFVSMYNGDNTYYWQYDCPAARDENRQSGTYLNGLKIGGWICECTSYAGWKAYEAYGLSVGWGHAYSWADGAGDAGYLVNNSPAAGTIGQAGGWPFGHVFWVESVNSDGSINVSEYNNAYATCLYLTGGDATYCGSGRASSEHYHYGDFGTRKIPANEVWQYNYIHLR